jgi:hypothetical protein
LGKGGFGRGRVAEGEKILEEEETRRDDAGGRGERPGTLPLPWVGGSCDGGHMGVETLRSLPRWAVAWGESARGGFNRPPSHHPPRTTKVGAEVGEDGASAGEDGVVARAAAVESRGLRRRGAPADPVGRGTPAVPAGSRGGTTGVGRGGRGRGGAPAVRAGIG